MSSPFAYPAWDLTTMVQLDSLPYSSVSFGQSLNSPGSFSGQLDAADPRLAGINYLESSRTGRTMLCVDLNGVLQWGGIIWTRRYQESSKVIQVGAMEFDSYYQARLQAFDYTSTWSTPADPMTIAKQIVQDAQGVSGGSVAGGIHFVLNPVGGSGTSISVSYPGTQLQTVDSIVSGLASMGYLLGFDYSFDVAYSGNVPFVTMNIWYPRQGRTYANSSIVVNGKDCIDWTYDEDSTKQYTQIVETGGGTSVPTTVSAAVPGYPLLEAAISHTAVNDESQLANMALSDLALSCYPVITPTLTLPVPLPDPITRVVDPSVLSLGQFLLGDDLIFKIDPVAGGGQNTSPRFPNGVYFEWRISNWTVTVPDRGVPTLLFDLTTPPVQAIPPPAPPLA